MPTIPAHLLMPRADHDGVLVDAGGALPRLDLELADQDTVVIGVRRQLRSSWSLDAVVLETHLPPAPDSSDSHVALAVLDAPDPAWTPPVGHRWGAPPATLPDRIGPRAGTWLEEWRTGAAPPELRPRWARPGWHARATRWIRGALDATGRPAAGEIEIRRLWGISVVARVPTADGGTAWFKAVFPRFDHEIATTRFLETVVPGAVPHVIAFDERQGWLLLDDVGGGGPIGSEASDDQLAAAIRRLVWIQARLAGHEDDLRAAGVPDRPLERLADDVADAMRKPAEIEGPAVTADRLATVAAWVGEQSAWLEAIGLPASLVHGDFHVFNVMERGGMPVIIDWSDAAISHPLLEIGPWFGHPGAPGDPERSWTAWLDALSSIGPVHALRGERERVLGLAAAFQLVSYARIVRGLEPATRYQLSDGVRDFWQLLEARVS
jgi:aminoglycoside phosphotransferase (APT) family kinase protein